MRVKLEVELVHTSYHEFIIEVDESEGQEAIEECMGKSIRGDTRSFSDIEFLLRDYNDKIIDSTEDDGSFEMDYTVEEESGADK